MSRMRIALCSLNQTPLDWIGNLRHIRMAIDQARVRGARLICLPELAVTGYGCEDMFYSPYVTEKAWALVSEIAQETGPEVVLLGIPLLHERTLYNAVAVLNQGSVVGIVVKSHLARDGIHYEPRWFRPWPLGKRDTYWHQGEGIPMGSLVFEGRGFKFGVEICEDAWVEDTKRPCLHLPDVHLVFNASASHFSMNKIQIRERIVRESSRRFGVAYAYANLVGCESGRAIYDGELMFAIGGEIVRRSRRLYLGEWETICWDLEYEPKIPSTAISVTLAEPHDGDDGFVIRARDLRSDDEEFAFAATLGLWDYMRKSKAHGFALSLSGGVDSATTAILVRTMVDRAIHELSEERIREILAHIPDLPASLTSDTLMRRLLVTAYQATRNSGDVTRHAASQLANGLGARHLELDVDAIVEEYKQQISQALGRPLTWAQDDVALQNIQARSRGPGMWMIANIERRLLLTTSNRSEVAVGYATMDGDTCGGLAPIAGVQKTFLREWLRRVERGEIQGVNSWAQLRFVNQQQPTAELRPPGQEQRDEDDLMPFEVLDELERLVTGDRLSPVQAFNRLCERHDREMAFQWTRKFFVLFAASQWKRERYAPSFHLDDRSLDPKTWARFPILSGCYEQELRDLENELSR